MKTNCAKKTILKMVPFFILVMLLLFSVGTKSYAASDNKLKRPKITGVTKKKDSLEVKWTKVADAKGYKIYITDEEYEDRCIATVKDPSITTYKIKGLKSGTKYSLKIRAYKRVDKKRVYSAFSPAKKVKTKMGLSKGHFSCKKFSVSWDPTQWKKEEAVYSSGSTNLLELKTNDKRVVDSAYFRITYSDPATSVIGKSLDDYATWYIDYDKSLYNAYKYERLANRVIDGREVAVLHATNTQQFYGKNNATIICPIGDKLLEISYYLYDDGQHQEEKLQQVEELLSKIKIK